MFRKDVAATVAVTGAVATFAYLNAGAVQTNNFLATPFTEAEREFINFIAEHKRSYGTKEEYQFRLEQFAKKYEIVKEHNADSTQTFTLAMNMFSDLTDAEYKMRLGYKKQAKETLNIDTSLDNSSISYVDWVDNGSVTPVKDQGSCGSCWSFSTTGALEGNLHINTGKLIPLSEQQLVDCNYGILENLGCNGGLMDKAFKYVKENGLTTESQYPYQAKHNNSCGVKSNQWVMSITGYTDVKPSSESSFLKALSTKGPVSVAIEADQLKFQLYSGGVFTENCGENLDHGVLAVGYGHESGQDYIKIKNSWSADWGENGYIKFELTGENSNGKCGVYLSASYPTGAYLL